MPAIPPNDRRVMERSLAWYVTATIAFIWNGTLLVIMAAGLLAKGNIVLAARAEHCISAMETIIMMIGFGASAACAWRIGKAR